MGACVAVMNVIQILTYL